jgi:hypothetical protein
MLRRLLAILKQNVSHLDISGLVGISHWLISKA